MATTPEAGKLVDESDIKRVADRLRETHFVIHRKSLLGGMITVIVASGLVSLAAASSVTYTSMAADTERKIVGLHTSAAALVDEIKALRDKNKELIDTLNRVMRVNDAGVRVAGEIYADRIVAGHHLENRGAITKLSGLDPSGREHRIEGGPKSVKIVFRESDINIGRSDDKTDTNLYVNGACKEHDISKKDDREDC
jgi:hypothetical protein